MKFFVTGLIHFILIAAVAVLFNISVTAQELPTADNQASSDLNRSVVVLPTNQNQSNGYVRPTAKKRVSRFTNDAFGLNAVIGAGIGATFGTIRNAPPEWKKTGGGFGRRFASDYAETAFQKSITFGLNEAFKLDDHLYKSGKRGFKARFKDAFLAGLMARTANGKRVFNFNRVIGTYAGSFIATEAWYPNRFSYKDGFRRGSQGLAFRFGFSFINEFLMPKR